MIPKVLCFIIISLKIFWLKNVECGKKHHIYFLINKCTLLYIELVSTELTYDSFRKYPV